MKKILMAGIALAALAGAAQAADLAAPVLSAPPPSTFVPASAFTWSGFYAGVNAGYAFGTDNNRYGSVSVPAGAFDQVTSGGLPVFRGPTTDSVLAYNAGRERDGFAGGGQIGYNIQFGQGGGFVIGGETDIQYADLGGRRRGGFYSFGPGAVSDAIVFVNPESRQGVDYFGTVRGRVGYAFNNVLVYGTGGFAYGEGGQRSSFERSNNNFKTGYAAGGGIEYALPTNSFLNFFNSSAVTVKLEGLYVNLERDHSNNGNSRVFAYDAETLATFTASGFKKDESFAVVRAGLNYKFGSY